MEKQMSLSQIKKKAIAPTLDLIGLGGDAAVNLITGTGLVESGYKYTRQINGPALSWFQIEPATHDDCWENYLRYHPALAEKIRGLIYGLTPSAHMLSNNARYAVAMCRVKYLRVPEPLPDANDAAGMSAYHKKYYNTALGKANETQNFPLFQEAIDA